MQPHGSRYAADGYSTRGETVGRVAVGGVSRPALNQQEETSHEQNLRARPRPRRRRRRGPTEHGGRCDRLASILRDSERCAYPAEQVRLLTGPAAGRDAILKALDDLAGLADSEATVVVYFSCHGYTVATAIGQAYFLMPFGYDLGRLHKTAIGGKELVDRLAAIPARKLLLLLDCCHAGGIEESKAPGVQLVKTPLPPEAEQMLAQGSGRVVIASSRAGELSYAGKPYSAFTLALIEALAGAGVAEQFRQSLVAWIAHASHADTYRLRRAMLSEIVL